MCVCVCLSSVAEFSGVMTAQLDMHFEAQALHRFSENFNSPDSRKNLNRHAQDANALGAVKIAHCLGIGNTAAVDKMFGGVQVSVCVCLCACVCVCVCCLYVQCWVSVWGVCGYVCVCVCVCVCACVWSPEQSSDACTYTHTHTHTHTHIYTRTHTKRHPYLNTLHEHIRD